MKPFVAVLSFALFASAGVAPAAAPLNPPRVYTGVYQPKGTPTKTAALAPRAGNKRHVYGAPIQKPIFKRQPVKSVRPITPQVPHRP